MEEVQRRHRVEKVRWQKELSSGIKEVECCSNSLLLYEIGQRTAMASHAQLPCPKQ